MMQQRVRERTWKDVDCMQLERVRERERIEREQRIERERVENERVEKERIEREQRIERERVEKERIERKQKEVDCMQIFALALLKLPEVVRARNLLYNMIQESVNVEVPVLQKTLRTQEQETKPMQVEMDMKQRNVTKMQFNQVQPAQDIFLYGEDVNRIRVVVEDALKPFIQRIPVITLSGDMAGNLSPEGLRALLSVKFRSCHNTHNTSKLIVLLEECSFSMYANYMESGFVSSNRARGIQITSIIWTSKSNAENFGCTTSRVIFVPSSHEVQVSSTSTDDTNMVIHKPAEPIYAKVQKRQELPQNDVQKQGMDVQKQAMNVPQQEKTNRKDNETLVGHYADLQLENSKNSNAVAVAEKVDAIQGQSATPKTDHIDSTYASMQPVFIKQPVSSEPAKPTPGQMLVSPGQTIVLTERNVECVVDMNLGEDETDHQERQADGFFGAIADCLFVTYACLLD